MKEDKTKRDFPKGILLSLSLIVSALIVSGTIFLVGWEIGNRIASLESTVSALQITVGESKGIGETGPEQEQEKEPELVQEPEPQPTTSLKTKDLMDGNPAKGSSEAPVVIIEFSDFQCPFCARFFSQTLPQIEEEYIETGKVEFVYRDFPLSFHPFARPSALAAECAGEQGKFWEFHDKIFENQASLSEESLKQWAEEIGLDTTAFDSCFDSEKYSNEVDSDFSDAAALGVSGTPTFFIGKRNGTPQKIVGAQPYSAFKQAIDSLIK